MAYLTASAGRVASGVQRRARSACAAIAASVLAFMGASGCGNTVDAHPSDGGPATPAPCPTTDDGTPIVLASAVALSPIAVDATSVYFDADDGLTAVSRCGGEPKLLAPGLGAAGLALDATAIYGTGGKGVFKVPLTGGTPTTLATVDPSSLAYGIAVDATNVYWTGEGDGTISKVPIEGGPSTTLATAPAWCVTCGSLEIAAHANRVYWLFDGPIGGTCPTDGVPNYPCMGSTVRSVPVGGGSSTTVVSGTWGPFTFAIDATSIYWIDGANDVVKKPLGGGTPVVLASGQRRPFSIAVDATHVYWTNLGTGGGIDDGTVMKVPIGGGEPVTLASGQRSPDKIVVDATSVYWTIWLKAGSEPIPVNVMKLTPK